MEPKLLSRDEFREAVFKRDNYECVFCGSPAQDAHHILERRLWPDGGYYLDNGASVCGQHHLACERTELSVEDVRVAAKITKPLVPPHLYDDHSYDKWGNPILGNGRRGKGELFADQSVQKVLREGGVLDLFTPYVKYPRTFHLPWSPGIHDDDKALNDASQFYGKRVIVTKKMDGENTSAYSDGHVHARSIDSRGGEDRAWVKQFLINNVCFNLPEGWRVVGENLWAEHSIHYDNLLSYFLGFSLWDEHNVCLSWDETLEYFELLHIVPVPVLYDGPWEGLAGDDRQQSGTVKMVGGEVPSSITHPAILRRIESKLNYDSDEGYVVRVADAFPYSQFRNSVAKYVRKGHVQTTKHWRAGRSFTPNELAGSKG